MRWISLLFILPLVGAALGALYLGAFRPMRVVVVDAGPWILAGLERRGSYNAVGSLIEEAQALAKAQGVTAPASYGLYYDDPRKVEEKDRRYQVGLALEALDDASRARLKKAGLKVSRWPEQRCLSVEFPHRSKLSFSLGAIKAYVALGRALPAGSSVAGPALEIYGADVITYLMPIRP